MTPVREDLLSPAPLPVDEDRRSFLGTKLATSFTLAVQPIAAQTAITTDTTGLTAGRAKVPAPGEEVPAYRAMPVKGKAFPVALVVQEIVGVHEHRHGSGKTVTAQVRLLQEAKARHIRQERAYARCPIFHRAGWSDTARARVGNH